MKKAPADAEAPADYLPSLGLGGSFFRTGCNVANAPKGTNGTTSIEAKVQGEVFGQGYLDNDLSPEKWSVAPDVQRRIITRSPSGASVGLPSLKFGVGWPIARRETPLERTFGRWRTLDGLLPLVRVDSLSAAVSTRGPAASRTHRQHSHPSFRRYLSWQPFIFSDFSILWGWCPGWLLMAAPSRHASILRCKAD